MEDLGIDLPELSSLSLADSPNRGRLDLREEIASLYDNVHPDEVLVTTGTGEALFILFHVLLKKDDLVSLFWPAFQALYEIPRMLGAKIQKVPVGSALDVRGLFANDPSLAIINHPHNPTGIGLPEGEIDELKQVAKNFRGHILFDEHYRFLDYTNDLSFSGAKLNENTFATGSVTKCFGVMGLKTGWMIGRKHIIDRARSFKDYLSHAVSPVSEFLTLKILQNRKKLILPIKENVKTNIGYFRLKLPLLKSISGFQEMQGGVVGFPKLQDRLSSEKFCDELHSNCGVFVLPGINFEEEGYIRIGFGEDPKKFREGIDRWVNWEKSGE